MPARKLISAAVVLVGLLTMAIFLLPGSAALACRPCLCPTNTSLNCYGDYAVYTKVDRNDNCSIEALIIDRDSNRPRGGLKATAAELAKLPESPEENMLVKQWYEIALYKLTSGEYQVNYGPDFEGKVYVLRFSGCPAASVQEEWFVAEQAG